MRFNFSRKSASGQSAFQVLPFRQIRAAQIDALRVLPDIPWYPADSWRALDAFQPRIIAGTQQALRKFCQYVRVLNLDLLYLDTAVYCLTILGDRPMTNSLRDELWEQFGVPMFEIFMAEGGRVLARECEAHDGWHVNTAAGAFTRLPGEPHLVFTRKGSIGKRFDPIAVGFTGNVTTDLCACGIQTPRVINLSADEVRLEEEEELMSAAS